jgi:hypothetical protein
MNEFLPDFFKIKQAFEAPAVEDAGFATRAALAQLPAAKFIRRGMKVAVGAGSRGITDYDLILRTVCQDLKGLGAEVFIVPAMGSHGGATAEGQLKLLASSGIIESTMGVPLRSSMEVVELGRTGQFTVYQDRNASGADAIVLVNRIKPHTDFHGPIESGLMKMAAIGFGKQKGAHQFHQASVRLGHADALLAVSREVLRLGKIVFGVGIIENQLHETSRVVAVPAAEIEQEEMKLLNEARKLMPRLPFDDVDLLIVDEMGKNLSGTGLDTNVIRREIDGSFLKPAPNAVRRIYVRSLHPHSYGNAAGIGMVDFIHERLLRAMDTQATWMNVISSLTPVNARVPMHFPNDRDALATAMQTTARPNVQSAKVLWIKNTLSCQSVLASEAYLDEARTRSDLALVSKPAPLAFDEQGDLAAVF